MDNLSTFILSKINSISPLWDNSSLSGEIPSEDGSTVETSGAKKNGSGGATKSVKTGRPKQSYIVHFGVKTVEDKRAIENILFNGLECTLTSTQGRIMNVFLDAYQINDNMKHTNRSKYSVTFTVQESGISPPISAKSDLADAKDNASEKLKEIIEKNAGAFSPMTSESMINGIKEQLENTSDEASKAIIRKRLIEAQGMYPAGFLGFVDPITDIMRISIRKILDVKLAVFSPLLRDKARINTVKKMFRAISNIKSAPQELADLLMEIATDLGIVEEIERSPFDTVRKSELLPLFVPEVNGRKVTELKERDILKKASRERESIAAQWIVCEMVNLTKLISDINLLFSEDFVDREDFESTVRQIYEYVGYCGLSGKEVRDIIHKVNMYANTQEYGDIVEIEVKEWTPLLRIVYDRYGNLENYFAISKLNNFEENARVRGTVKVLA